MITAGICVMHLYSSVIFKVIRLDSNRGVTIMPYRESEQIWDRDNLTIIPGSSIGKLTEVQCPRERREYE